MRHVDFICVNARPDPYTCGLRRCGYLASGREIGQKRFDLWSAHTAWMALVVEQDEAFDPACIRFFGANAEMLRRSLPRT